MGGGGEGLFGVVPVTSTTTPKGAQPRTLTFNVLFMARGGLVGEVSVKRAPLFEFPRFSSFVNVYSSIRDVPKVPPPTHIAFEEIEINNSASRHVNMAKGGYFQCIRKCPTSAQSRGLWGGGGGAQRS